MSRTVSILLVDDHAMMRRMLGNRLDEEPDMTVVACVGDADEAVAKAAQLEPDIVVMDIDMPGKTCFAAAEDILRRRPETRIVFLSAFFNDRYIEQAIAVQAWGFITKSETEEAVVKAVRDVSSGIAYFSAEVRARLVVDGNGAKLAHKGQSRASTLTNREMEVLRYLARGMSKKEIARTMHISPNTVTNHATHLMAKLDVHDRVELSRFAIREGLAEA